jgi:hypothetical protein
MKLGEALVKRYLITKQQLNLALERQVTFGGRIGTNLLELRIINESEFSKFLSEYFKLPVVTNEIMGSIPKKVLCSVSKDIVEKYKILPISKEGKKLHVAMLNANNLEEVDELSFVTGFHIIPYAITEFRLFYALGKYYGIKTDTRYIRFIDRFDPEIEVTDSIDKVKIALSKVENADRIAEIILRLARTTALRVAIFKISEGKIAAWKSIGFSTEGLLMKDKMSILSEVAGSRQFYRGPLQNSESNAPLIKVLSGLPQDILVFPLAVREKVIAILYIDNGNDSVLDSNVFYIYKLASMASLAFEILALREQLLQL